MRAKPFTLLIIVAVSLALGTAGCEDVVKPAAKGAGEGVIEALAIFTAPIWVPAGLIYCAAAECRQLRMSATSSASSWRTQADKGDPYAQLVLATMYLKGGADVSQDDAEAAKWYRRSADGGNWSAQFALGSLYEWGRGVGPDDVQADMWYSVAITTMSADGKVAEPTRSRDELEKRMTPEQIAEARRRAQEWKPSTVPAPSGNGNTVSNGATP